MSSAEMSFFFLQHAKRWLLIVISFEQVRFKYLLIITGWMTNSVDLDHTRSVSCDQGPHYLLRPDCANTVNSRYLDFPYLELPLNSKWKTGPCFNTEIWQ